MPDNLPTHSLSSRSCRIERARRARSGLPATADAAQYTELMKPEPIRLSPVMSIPMGHSEVTGFIAACVAEGLNVECSAVARPEVDLDATAALAKSLGATFRERSWHP